MTTARDQILSIADILTQSGFSKGALYHHFKDKDALFDATIDQFFLRFFEVGRPEDSEETLLDVLRDLADGYVRLFAAIEGLTSDRTRYYRFVFAILPMVRVEMTEQLAQVRLRLVNAAARDQANGDFGSDLDPARIADLCLSAIEGTGVLLALEQDKDVQLAFAEMVRNVQIALHI